MNLTTCILMHRDGDPPMMTDGKVQLTGYVIMPVEDVASLFTGKRTAEIRQMRRMIRKAAKVITEKKETP